MANILDKIFDMLRLSYDDDDYEEDDYGIEEKTRNSEKKKKAEEKAKAKAEAARQKELSKEEQNQERAAKKEQRSQSSWMEGNSSRSTVERVPVRSGPSKVSVLRGGNSSMESQIISVHPKDDKAKQEIGEGLLQGKTVIINLEGLEWDMAQSIVDFTSGVCYAIKGDMKSPSKYMLVAVPNEVQLSGAFEKTAGKTTGRTGGTGSGALNN